LIKIIAVFIILQLGVVYQVCSGEIKTATVQYENGVYTISFEATLAATQPNVFRIVTDYSQLSRLNDMIDTSSLLTRPGHFPAKREIIMHTCVLFYCRQVTLVETVNEYNMDTVIAMIVPAESDFMIGESRWWVKSMNQQTTQIILNSRLQPNFWIPPVIGPWLIKKKMIKEISVMVERLELLAN
jgi:hypothetical protein